MGSVKRGDVVTVALQGDLGKPRPARVVQSDLFEPHPSVVLLPITSELQDLPLFRLRVEPSITNGLSRASDIMIDTPQSVTRDTVRQVIGRADDATLVGVNRLLAVFLGIAWLSAICRSAANTSGAAWEENFSRRGRSSVRLQVEAAWFAWLGDRLDGLGSRTRAEHLDCPLGNCSSLMGTWLPVWGALR